MKDERIDREMRIIRIPRRCGRSRWDDGGRRIGREMRIIRIPVDAADRDGTMKDERIDREMRIHRIPTMRPIETGR